MTRIPNPHTTKLEWPHESLIEQSARLVNASRACNERSFSFEGILKTVKTTMEMARDAKQKIQHSDEFLANIQAQGLWSSGSPPKAIRLDEHLQRD